MRGEKRRKISAVRSACAAQKSCVFKSVLKEKRVVPALTEFWRLFPHWGRRY